MATNVVKKMDKGPDADVLDAAMKKVKLDKLAEDPIDRAAKQLKINLPAQANLKTKATALAAYFLQHTEKKDLVECDTCEGPSDINLDNCPFCGSTGDVDPVAETEPAPQGAVDAPAAPVAKKQSAKKSAGKESNVGKQSAALAAAVAPVAVNLIPVTVQNLDEAVTDVKQLAQNAHVSAWKLGDRLKSIYDAHLWKARLADDGKTQAYKTYDQFLKAELGFGKKYAFVLMKVSGRFTESQVQELGPSKLHLVLEAPKEMQAELLEKAKKGASKKQLERELPRVRDPKKTKEEKAKRKAGGSTTQITVASILRRQTVKLFMKPAKKGDEPKPAKKLAEVPWGSIDLANDVRMLFQITQTPTGELRLIVDTRRVDPVE